MLQKLDHIFDLWITKPEANAAGRISLYRVLYALFYLMVIQFYYHKELGSIPDGEWKPMYLLKWLPSDMRPNPTFFSFLELLLVFNLLLLLIGYKVRLATILVLGLGMVLALFRYSFGIFPHYGFFLEVYIPVAMIFSRWNSNYSLDAYLLERQGQVIASPKETHWRYFWMPRALLLLLAFLFLSASYVKLLYQDWYQDDEVMHRFLLTANLTDALPQNSISFFLAQYEPLYKVMHITGLIFEWTFCLALLHPHLRNFYLASALLFHSLNYFILRIPFAPFLILYLIFVDWQQLYEQLPARVAIKNWIDHIPTPRLVPLTLLSAVLFTLFWNNPLLSSRWLLRPLNPSYLWYVILPIAAIILLKAVYNLLLDLIPRISKSALKRA